MGMRGELKGGKIFGVRNLDSMKVAMCFSKTVGH